MKNKSTIYIVLPIVIGLWAFVIFKILQIYNHRDGSTISQSSFTSPVFSLSNNDAFSIKADYRDPFLGKIQVEKTKPSKLAQPKQTTTPTTITWPSIVFEGIIKNRKSNTPMCMILINGESVFMNEGDIASDVLLKKIYTDSIQVTFNKSTRFIKKQ